MGIGALLSPSRWTRRGRSGWSMAVAVCVLVGVAARHTKGTLF